jgi:hypothetical protein
LDVSVRLLHRWLYLVFFNMLWVVFPLYSLYETYQSLVTADVELDVAKKTS